MPSIPRPALLLLVSATVACPPLLAQGARPVVSPFSVDSAVRAQAVRPIWPGFDARTIPLAISDGRNTALFRHPQPPEGYRSLSRSRDTWLMAGRDPAVVANSSAMIGGVSTATVMLAPDETRPVAELAALAIHELFHVYQRRTHPGWTANEVDLFTYPTDDTLALALRREETFALQEGLTSADGDESACWAEAFGRVRAARFARLGAAAAAYERGTELNEGLAHFVELEARGAAVGLATHEYPADQVRARAYDVGAGIATALDLLSPAWRDTLERAPASAALTLDGLLARAAAARRTSASPQCSAVGEQRLRWAADATREVDSLAAGRTRSRASFVAQPGWSLVVEAEGTPLSATGFDPLHVSRVSPSEVLHRRYLQLGGGGTSVSLLGRAALTEGRAGAHPLFGGVRRLTVTGLSTPPSVRDSAGTMVIEAEGVRVTARGASVDQAGQRVRVRLP